MPTVANVTNHVLSALKVFPPEINLDQLLYSFTTGNLNLSLFLLLHDLDFLNIIYVPWWNSCFNNVSVEVILKKELVFLIIRSSRFILQTILLLFFTYAFTTVFFIWFLAFYSQIVSPLFSITLKKMQRD